LAVASLLLAPSAYAADTAHDWLMKMSAARHLDYEGTFVYQHDTQLEAMRIIHKVVGGMPRERLVSLNGAPREIIRDAREVRCYLPDENSIVIEHRKAGGRGFPGVLPERVSELDENYVIQLGRTGRVSGRGAQLVLIRPRDGYRYGYRLWADRETGLLLKADLLDDKGKLLEQFMFTHLRIGGDIPPAALEPEMSGQGMTWHRESDAATSPAAAPWDVVRLPKGFRLSRHMTRTTPVRRKPVEHLVFSDGLAAVSIFIEQETGDAKNVMHGSSRMGAVHAFGKRLDGHHVTVVGEVPAATVTLIGGSVTPRP
jgi:sigma-E factor negative regulatory protein RseB